METPSPKDKMNQKTFKLRRRNLVIAGLIFMFGFYVSSKLIGDIFLTINGFDYSYQINTNKTLKILILCSILSVVLTLFYTISFLVPNMIDKNGIKVMKKVVFIYTILLSIYQVIFFNSNHQSEIDQGYKEILKVVNAKYQQDINKDLIMTQIQKDKIELNEDQLINYIKHRKNLIIAIKKPS